MLEVTQAWQESYPAALAGVLAMREVANPDEAPALEARKGDLEAALRAGYPDKATVRASPAVRAYDAYFSRYKKTYHVQLQLESVALKGKSLPRVAALVEAMFMAELKNQLLTAGHNLDGLQTPLRLDVADGSESYVAYNGQTYELKPGDMYIADALGIISSVLGGPDQRTRIQPGTRSVVFTVYAAPGIDRQAVLDHLHDIEDNARLISPGARTELLQVYP
jgi:DNA/RNA-binding domain of Phe-tRNA-synthetase-like protein